MAIIISLGTLSINDEWDDDDLPEVAQANATARARLVVHMLSRKWKPAAWRAAVNVS